MQAGGLESSKNTMANDYEYDNDELFANPNHQPIVQNNDSSEESSDDIE